MNDYDYWKKQGTQPLYPEVDLDRPEQRKLAGKVLIIGGNKNAFFTVVSAMAAASKNGVGEARVLMPSSMKNQVPITPDVYFAPAEKGSGAFGKESINEMLLQASWADAVIIIGDIGRNAETTLALADFLKTCDKPVYLTRDAIDAAMLGVADWSIRTAKTSLLLTLPQLQKLFRTLYYPKVISLSMPMNQLIEALHKFTLSYSMVLATFHNGQIVVAQKGNVVTQALTDTKWTQLTLWAGTLLVQMVLVDLWNVAVDAYKCFATALLIGDK